MGISIKLCVLSSGLILASFVGCKSDSSKDYREEDNKMDTIIEKTEEQIQDVNQGIIEGYDKSKEEIKEQIDDMKTDSV